MEAKFKFDGKEITLTEGDLKKIGVTEEKIKEFADAAERNRNAKMFLPNVGANYYVIASTGDVVEHIDCATNSEKCHAVKMASVGNYCRDKEIMEARAALETLSRLVWRESMIAGGNKIPWSGGADHWFIYLDYLGCDVDESPKWNTTCVNFSRDPFTPYFPDRQSARRVIDTVIEPFIAQNPHFIDALRGKC